MMLEGRGQLMPEDYDNQLYVNEIPAHREAVFLRLASIFAAEGSPHYDGDNRYLQLLGESFARLRRLDSIYRDLLGIEKEVDRNEAIRRHIAAYDDLGKAYARILIEQIDAILERAMRIRKDPARKGDATGLSADVTTLRDAIVTLGEGPYRDSLLAIHGKAVENAVLLQADGITVEVMLYQIDALMENLLEMKQMLAFYQIVVDSLEYLGGLPAHSAFEGSFRHYESGRRLKALAALSRQESLQHVITAWRSGMNEIRTGSFDLSQGRRILLSDRTAFRYRKPVTGGVAKGRYESLMNEVWNRNKENPVLFYGDAWEAYGNVRQETKHGWSVPREYKK
jgi:hypothetical protein